MGNRPCPRCSKTTWFWSDPDLGCNLCVPPNQDPANGPVVWNGNPLQGLVCTCTHTLASHSRTRGDACLYPGCGCLTFVATEPYVPRHEI